MTDQSELFLSKAKNYIQRLNECFTKDILEKIEVLNNSLRDVWVDKRKLFICGNGGSAANALHMANDFHYGVGACGLEPKISGMRVEALPANVGIVTCLANDTGYENIYSHMLEVKGNQDDLLLVLSGSGNSPNITNALKMARKINMKSCAVLAFDGGLCKDLADQVIHFPIYDMQIAEDTQLIIGHICMQWLNENKADIGKQMLLKSQHINAG